MEANNFELKPTLISMVQQCQFGGTLLVDPDLHLSVFLEVCDIVKLNGVSTDAIWLRLFPFSLGDKARVWPHSLHPGCITRWMSLLEPSLPNSSHQANGKFEEPNHQLYPNGWWDTLWGLGAVQRLVVIVPWPRPSLMNDSSSFPQWSDPTYKVHYRCCGRGIRLRTRPTVWLRR